MVQHDWFESCLCGTYPASTSTSTVSFIYSSDQVKGGGHIAVPGFNSTTGVLIDLMQFNHINYIQATTFVDVGPGQNWDAVSTYLITWYGVNVNGATTCSGVGVAGFNLGGGYGNKTNQFGLAIDNIQSMVVALPTGDIVTADETNNKDLFWALKVRFWSRRY